MQTVPEFLVGLTFVAAFALTRSISHPATLQPLVWLASLSLLAVLKDNFYPVPMTTRMVFALASVSFTVGALVAARPFWPGLPSLPPKPPVVRDLSILVVAATAYSLALIQSAAPFSLSLDYFAHLRSVLSDDDGALFGMPGTLSILFGVYIVTMTIAPPQHPHQMPIAVVCWTLLSALLLSKFTFLMVVIAILFALNYRQKLGRAHVLGGLLLLISMFALITGLRHVDDSAADDFISDFLKVYISSAVPAFSETTGSEPLGLFGYTFRVPSLWLNRLGADLPVHQLIQEFVFTPLPTNVFTYLHPYFLEMGLMGAIALPFVLGSVHGQLHQRAIRGSHRSQVFSSLLMYPLLMQFFVEQYFLWLTNWLYIAVLLLMLLKRPLTRRSDSTVGCIVVNRRD